MKEFKIAIVIMVMFLYSSYCFAQSSKEFLDNHFEYIVSYSMGMAIPGDIFVESDSVRYDGMEYFRYVTSMTSPGVKCTFAGGEDIMIYCGWDHFLFTSEDQEKMKIIVNAIELYKCGVISNKSDHNWNSFYCDNNIGYSVTFGDKTVDMVAGR